jgi:hypothetical protein
MNEGKLWEENEKEYLVLDSQASTSPVLQRMSAEKIFWSGNYWKRSNQFRVYHVHNDQIMTTKEFVTSGQLSGFAILLRGGNGQLRVRWRSGSSIRTKDVAAGFVEQYVGAYLFDNEHAEDRERFVPNNFQRKSLEEQKQKAAQEQKEREEKEALRQRLEKAKNAIPSPLLAELRENIQKHCKTLRSLPVKRLRELVKTVTEKSEIDEDIKDRILIAHQKWNKRELCNWLSHQGEVKMDKIPEKFLDPVYGTVMLDPVVLPFDGTTVDRATYLRIMREDGGRKNPFTQELIPVGLQPIPNKYVREAIEKYLVKYGIDPVTAAEDD